MSHHKVQNERQEQETVTSVESKQYRRAIAQLYPTTTKEALWHLWRCACDPSTPRVNALPVPHQCAKGRRTRHALWKIKWKWTHASAKNPLLPPPDTWTTTSRATMKIIRDNHQSKYSMRSLRTQTNEGRGREDPEEEAHLPTTKSWTVFNQISLWEWTTPLPWWSYCTPNRGRGWIQEN